jgi:AcrR family transcriptional regulator
VKGRRALNRIARTSEFLSTALTIVTTEGFDALTMGRLASDVDAAVGAVYRYFPSKGALVAEVQREAIERLASSYVLIRDRSDRRFHELGLPAGELALARLVLFGRFFAATAETHPQELKLLQMLMSEWRAVVPVEDALRVVPSAMRLLDRARQAIDEAETVGALSTGSSMDRVIIWAAGMSGIMQVSRLDVFDAELFDGQRLALEFLMDLFVGWGADRAGLDLANARVDEIATLGPLAPRPAEGR